MLYKQFSQIIGITEELETVELIFYIRSATDEADYDEYIIGDKCVEEDQYEYDVIDANLFELYQILPAKDDEGKTMEAKFYRHSNFITFDRLIEISCSSDV